MSAVDVEASVVLPTYNEESTIGSCISGIRHYTERTVEVIVVDDGDDATAEIVHERWGDDPHVQLLKRERSTGLSSAVLEGFDAAQGDLLACMDADLQHPPASLPVLLTVLEDEADMVLGSRHCATGGVAADWPLQRQIISYGASLLAWVAVPQARTTSDPMTGFFAIRQECVDVVRDQLNPTGYKIALELLARCPIPEVAEIGYTFEDRQGGSSNLGATEYVAYVRHLTRLSIPARLSSSPSARVVADG